MCQLANAALRYQSLGDLLGLMFDLLGLMFIDSFFSCMCEKKPLSFCGAAKIAFMTLSLSAFLGRFLPKLGPWATTAPFFA
jgi:hypothetical protein